MGPFRNLDDTPKHNPDSPPDTNDPAGPCPRCGRVSNFGVVGKVPVTLGGSYTVVNSEGRRERDDFQQAAILECLGCHQRTVVIEDKWVGNARAAVPSRQSGTIHYRGLWWWPPPGAVDLDAAVPERIRHAYQEGVRAQWAKAPRAAAVMYRRTLEGIVKTSASTAAQAAASSKNLAAGLRVMADEGSLDANLAEWANEIRIVANAGAHFDLVDDVTAEEADDLGRLLREMMRYLYEMPARVKRSRSSSPPTDRP